MRSPKQIHPFPARMAPEIALDALKGIGPGSRILDPMCGSGTVLKHAVEEGHTAVGLDSDPLAVLLSRVACNSINRKYLINAANKLVAEARALKRVSLPWIDQDRETQDFISFWFADRQVDQLRRLASLLILRNGSTADALRVALSRTVITKDSGASLARDVSHSRPHRVKFENSFDVFDGFLRSTEKIGSIIERPVDGDVQVTRKDARKIPKSLHGKFDLVITSPPYFNAIDYMRGHRLSLVWMGHQLADLRTIRSNSVGSERKLVGSDSPARQLVPRHRGLSSSDQSILDRYALDTRAIMCQISRALKPDGKAVVVIGDTTYRGVYIKNSVIVEKAGELAGLQRIDRRSRRIPSSSRYLPPPRGDDGPMSKRMRSEVVLQFEHSNVHSGD